MPTFLTGTNRGWVKKLQSPAGAAGAIVSGVDIMSCMITQATVSEQCNVQVLHTLGQHVFVYVFGDRVGDMGVGGLAYFDCDGQGNHGVGNAIAWYRQNKVSNSGKRVSVTLGGTNFEGYLTSFRATAQRPEDALVEFFLGFKLIPD